MRTFNRATGKAWKPEFEARTQWYHHIASSTGDDGDALFSRPRDLDLIQSLPSVDLINMKAPPRVLTLSEEPLEYLETDQTASSQSNPSQAVRVIFLLQEIECL